MGFRFPCRLFGVIGGVQQCIRTRVHLLDGGGNGLDLLAYLIHSACNFFECFSCLIDQVEALSYRVTVSLHRLNCFVNLQLNVQNQVMYLSACSAGLFGQLANLIGHDGKASSMFASLTFPICSDFCPRT